MLKVDNYMPRTTDLEGSKTEDSCDTNLHNLSSRVNILNFGKSNVKLHFFGPNSCSSVLLAHAQTKCPCALN